MGKWRYRFEMYKYLQANSQSIYAEARKISEKIGITPELRGTLGFTGAVSGCHGLLTRDIIDAMDEGSRKVIPNSLLDEQVREIVKDVYGDDYDAACINTCEAALWVTYDVLFTPPFTGRGDNYRSRYIAPYERHMHHQAGYGRPFPPRYKDLYADRGATAGELGFYGKRLNNLDVVIVPLAGAKYEAHGLKYHPAPLLVGVDAGASVERIARVAELHTDSLVGFASLAYDTPGYGYGNLDEDGTPTLQRLIGELAQEYHVPYVADNAWGMPFVGTDLRKTNADVTVYSVDKAMGGPTAGLIVGKEEVMVPIRRALGIHGERWGTGLSHGKAAYVTVDPGKEALLGTIAALKRLRDEPHRLTDALDRMEEIVKQEFEQLDPSIKDGWLITKTYNSLAIELNYQGTWKDGRMGIPIFTIEDMYAGSNLIQHGMSKMGLVATIGYDGNILISPGLGTTDESGELLEKPTRLLAKALVKLLEIISRYAGLIEEKMAVAAS